MPSTSKTQQRLMGVAYAVKSGDMQLSDVDTDYRDKVKDLVDNMTTKQLKDFAETKHEGLPEVVEEGVMKIDLKRILTRISGAIGYKQDPNMRQELLAAFEEDIREIMARHDYIVENEDYTVNEADFYNIEPGNIGGMGPVSLPGVDAVGSGDVLSGTGSAKDRYEDEEEERKKQLKKKKKKSVLEFEDFIKEQEQQQAFSPDQPKGESLGEDDYEPGPSNDPDLEFRERQKALKKAKQIVTFAEYRKM
jgi:hypothetical protein